MGFSFRKSIKVLPGVRVNLSKTGTSLSVGTRGATVNVGKKGFRATVGIPGSGLSYSEMVTKPERERPSASSLTYSKGAFVFSACCFFVMALVALAMKSGFMAVVFGLLGLLGLVAAMGAK